MAEILAGILPAISGIIPYVGAALAGIGLWNILSTFFGGGTQSTTVTPVPTTITVDPLSQLISSIMSMQMISVMMQNLANMFKPVNSGIDLSGILTAIVPVIAIVLVLKLIGKI